MFNLWNNMTGSSTFFNLWLFLCWDVSAADNFSLFSLPFPSLLGQLQISLPAGHISSFPDRVLWFNHFISPVIVPIKLTKMVASHIEAERCVLVSLTPFLHTVTINDYGLIWQVTSVLMTRPKPCFEFISWHRLGMLRWQGASRGAISQGSPRWLSYLPWTRKLFEHKHF